VKSGGDWTRGTEPKGISFKPGKERDMCKQNWGVIREIEEKYSSVTAHKERMDSHEGQRSSTV